jgi:hypothetical protein
VLGGFGQRMTEGMSGLGSFLNRSVSSTRQQPGSPGQQQQLPQQPQQHRW